MDAAAFLALVRSDRAYREQVVHTHVFEPRPAVCRAPRTPLPPRLRDMLAASGIDSLYSHQADACDAIAAGENVVIATGTASGKSLCYHLPVLAQLLDEPESRALYLFPAKALAYDQLTGLERLIERAGLGDVARPACYDGDTPTHKRTAARRHATILLTNPDMLHQSVLPYHPKWAGFFARLQLVVLDEIHTYRGIFGSHVANVVRRLQRICAHYGAEPRFVCCSATIANPGEHAERLLHQPVHVIDADGSPRGRKRLVLWNPPLLERFSAGEESGAASRAAPPAPPSLALRVGTSAGEKFLTRMPAAPAGARRSGNIEAQELFQRLIEAGAGTIVFTKARVVAELIFKYTREALARKRPDLVERIRPYRGGYLPNERREIEGALFSGRLLGVCSTNALELGIDVGALDAAVIVGFPSTLCSLWQQAGRAGRRQEDSLVILVAYDDPIDQFLMRNPQFLTEAAVERAIADPQNPHVLAAQLGCAAFELPLSEQDLAQFGTGAAEIAATLVDAGRLAERPAAATRAPASADSAALLYWANADFPAAATDLRTISSSTYAIVDVTSGRSSVLGNVDSISAPEQVYPGAIYLHQAEAYLVRDYDMQARVARVERYDADYYTQPVLASHCRLVAERERAQLASAAGSTELCFGDVEVRWQTIAYRKFKFHTTELIGQTKLELPPQTINTRAFWIQPPPAALAAAADAGPPVSEALSGVRNLLMVALPPLAMCDRYDIGGVVDSAQLGVPAIFVYDRFEGGMGYARAGYDQIGELLRLAWELVSGCRCANGCPACVGPPNLRVAIHHDPDLYRSYEIPDKAATLALLNGWLGVGHAGQSSCIPSGA